MDSRLWYKQPAARWEEALPIGNGRIGGMVFGGDTDEMIALNEDTLWSGFPRDTINYDALRHLKRARELIFAREYKEAERLIGSAMLGRRTESYQPLGNIRILHHYQDEESKAYRYRELELQTSVAMTVYEIEGITYRREAFVSAVDQVMVVRVASQENAPIRLTVLLDSLLKHKVKAVTNGDLVMYGKAPSHIADNYLGDHPQSVLYEEGLGLSFEVHVRVLDAGADVTIVDDSQMDICGKGEVTILLAAATNFTGYDQMPENGDLPGESGICACRCIKALNGASMLSYAELRQRHEQDHGVLFRRVELELGSHENLNLNPCAKGSTVDGIHGQAEPIVDPSQIPTDERLRAYQAGNHDPMLEALYFHYGRYLLIASSRPGTQPAHLQGIWNPHVQPPWNSDYTTNINTEMNYWPAEVCNLSELHGPLFDLISDLSQAGARTAHIHYGCRGWTAHHNVDLWRMSTPSDGDPSWAFWPMGGVWLCRHLWEHYAYTQNKEFLRDKAYPLMKGAAEFCLDWLVPGPSGELVTVPSTSPENRFLTDEGEACSIAMASAMDLFLISELFAHCIQAADILGIDAEFSQILATATECMAKPAIGSDGRLLEWNEEFAEAEPGHRHVSHLYGLYPGEAITPDKTPELAEAARLSLKYRIDQGGGHTGWSCAWLINLYARLRDGEQAHHFVNTLLSRSTYPNLFDDHPPFQIDGNFGGTAGIAEMLLQSHQGAIELLPALPQAWPSGRFSGLKARGGYTISAAWEKGRLHSATIQADVGGWCVIRYREPLSIIGPDGQQFAENERFMTRSGDVYRVCLRNESSFK